ncbi:hypothetical protein EVAR_31401_1 [Eumeta japonica]|uniref:Uncharacterized protein n=1 Tax=Eumeta variegata TaxID=151549 RepID=A0A4C1UZ34_EUMVA|nr:hypothetical protein EVAR_31401_1 [Eumeta japonica]
MGIFTIGRLNDGQQVRQDGLTSPMFIYFYMSGLIEELSSTKIGRVKLVLNLPTTKREHERPFSIWLTTVERDLKEARIRKMFSTGSSNLEEKRKGEERPTPTGRGHYYDVDALFYQRGRFSLRCFKSSVNISSLAAWGCCRPSSAQPASCGSARSRCGSAARSSRAVVSTLQKLNLLAYTRVFSCLGLLPAKLNAAGGLRLSALSLWLGSACLGLLPAKLDAAGGLRLSALSLWLGRAFVACSSEYITKVKPLSLHARVQLPGAVAGQAQRGRRAAAQRIAVARQRVVACSTAWGCCRQTQRGRLGSAHSRCGSAARSSRAVVSTLKVKPLSLHARVQLPGAAAGQAQRGRRVRLSALSLWLGRAFVACSSEYITKIKPLSLRACSAAWGCCQAQRGRRAGSAHSRCGSAARSSRAVVSTLQKLNLLVYTRVFSCLGLLPAKLSAAGGCGSARSRCGSAARSSRAVVSTLQKLNLLVYTRVFSCLGLLPAKLNAAGGLRLSALSLWLGSAFVACSTQRGRRVRLSALSLWLGRAFVACSSEYITKVKPLSLHARVQLPGAAAGCSTRPAGGSAHSLWLGSAFVACSSEYITKLNLLAYTRLFSCLGLLPAKLNAAGGLRLSALSLWLGSAFVAYSSEPRFLF